MSDTPSPAHPGLPAVEARGTLWHHADFRKLWIGQTVSLFGGRFTGLAVQIIAAVTLGASPAQMGILAAADSAPFLLVGLIAGVWIDRHRKRPIMISADLGRALLLATIPVAAVARTLSIDQLYAVSFSVGVLNVFFDVSYTSYLPDLVERSQLVEGNSKLVASRSAANVAGLSAAGVVIQAISAPLAIVVDACSYLGSALCLLLVRHREKSAVATHASVLGQAREGIGLVLGNPMLRAFAGCTATSNFTSSIFFALYILFGTRALGLGAAALGLIYGIGVVGGVVGGLVAPGAARRLGVGPALVGATVMGAAEVLPAAFATPDLAIPLLLLSSLLGNFGWTVYGVNATSLRQAITPLPLQGRTNATMEFLVAGVLPLGGLAGGALGQVIGPREAIAVAAVGSLLSVLWVAFSPVPRLRQIAEVAAG